MKMDDYRLSEAPVAKAEMLIRKPVAEVFDAFIDPAITTRFWFTKSSGRLEPGRQVRWEWEMYGAGAEVQVKVVEKNARILIEWPGNHGPASVEWVFTSRADHTTFVSITSAGFQGSGDEVIREALDNTEAFTLVLAGLKAFLEHDLVLNLVADRFPDQVINS